jgi:starch-binding outer membrane protein, SusD/RagB family
MKRNFFITGIFALLILSGCQKLDPEVITTLNYKQVIHSYDYVKQLNSGVYASLQNGFLYIGGQAMMASATDEAEHTLETATVQKFNSGSWNALDNPDNVWSAYFTGIRRANEFLISADSANLDQYKYDPLPASQTVYQTRLAELKNWKYEVRFLRAYFYFELVKRYGGLPIITTVGSINDNYSAIKRNTLAECFKFISDECDSAAAKLPVAYTVSGDFGRITKVAALALKSRLLLYKASDLYNSSSWATGYVNPELISIVGGDRTAQWQAAADAAKAVISLTGTPFSSLGSYSSVFGSSTYNNAEVIFRRANSNDNSFEKASTPIGFTNGSSGTTPSANLVDDYEVKVDANTARPFDWTNPVDAASPYTNRDPRLGMTVLVNGNVIKGRAIEPFNGGLDGKPVPFATKTGYYLNKYVNNGLDLINGTTSNHAWVYFRFAEMFLNYAEALNEAQPGNTDIALYVNKVRQRTGVAMPALPAGLTQAKMRDAIRHERKIEFAFEDQRYWDVRRWMLGTTLFNAPLKGVNIDKNATTGVFTYTPIIVENRVFLPQMYFYPIPQSELFIATSWKQNPLW